MVKHTMYIRSEDDVLYERLFIWLF